VSAEKDNQRPLELFSAFLYFSVVRLRVLVFVPPPRIYTLLFSTHAARQKRAGGCDTPKKRQMKVDVDFGEESLDEAGGRRWSVQVPLCVVLL